MTLIITGTYTRDVVENVDGTFQRLRSGITQVRDQAQAPTYAQAIQVASNIRKLVADQIDLSLSNYGVNPADIANTAAAIRAELNAVADVSTRGAIPAGYDWLAEVEAARTAANTLRAWIRTNMNTRFGDVISGVSADDAIEYARITAGERTALNAQFDTFLANFADPTLTR